MDLLKVHKLQGKALALGILSKVYLAECSLPYFFNDLVVLDNRALGNGLTVGDIVAIGERQLFLGVTLSHTNCNT